jgi:hypothetical protein
MGLVLLHNWVSGVLILSSIDLLISLIGEGDNINPGDSDGGNGNNEDDDGAIEGYSVTSYVDLSRTIGMS